MAKANKTSAAHARATKGREQALMLRRSGYGYRLIAEKLGLSKTRAHQLVKEGLESAKEQIVAHADALRTEEVSRLDGMLRKAYKAAEGGDLQAIDRVLKIGERRAKLLGLDAPVRTALQGGGEDAPPITTVTEAKVTFYMPDNGRG
jgi:hypothetical protein